MSNIFAMLSIEKNKAALSLRVLFFAVLLLMPYQAFAAPGATIVSRGVEKAYGELPEADGYADLSLQERVNAQLRSAASELREAVRGKSEVIYSYEVVRNTGDFLSIIIKADSESGFLSSRSVNLNPKTGNPYALNELFVANEQFFAVLEQELGWMPDTKSSFALGDQGLIFVRPADGQLAQAAYHKLLSWVDIGRSVYYLDVYYLTEASDNKLLRVKQGDLVILRLESNKSSGYVWQSASSDFEPTLKYMGSSYLISSAAIGANGWDLLMYGAAQKGETSISMQYKRPWQNQVVNSVKVDIIVE